MNSIQSLASGVQLVGLDVDGTLTDGRIIIGADGEMAKFFSVRDGLGLRLLMDAGIAVAIITARESSIVTARCRELRIDHVLQAVGDKATALSTLADSLNIPLSATAFMGDDLPDLPAMQIAGLAACVGNASAEVRAQANWIADQDGGHGAVRSFAEMLLKSRGGWAGAITRFTGDRQ
ncbi:MAG: KdsC family phosphatase [Burkholderiaceae bacterium]